MRKGVNASGGMRDALQDVELREMMIDERWMDALWREIERQLGKTRQEINGVADTSQNPTLDFGTTRAVCYTPPPLTTGIEQGMARAIGDNSGPSLYRRYSQLAGVLGEGENVGPMPSDLAWLLGHAMLYWVVCNDAGVYVNYADGKLVKQLVKPSLLRGMGDPADPGTPILLGWNRPIRVGEKVYTDAWDIWNILKRNKPSYAIVRGPTWHDDGSYTGGTDMTRDVLESGPLVGEAYPWRWTQGDRADRPFIPVQMYHGRYPHSLFSRHPGSGLTQGTLTHGVLQSFLLHIARDCSWPDRNVRGLNLVGAAAEEHDQPRSVPNDPAAIKQWEDENPEKPGQFHQWAAGADPKSFGEFVRSHRQLLDEQSVPADISSIGGDPLTHRLESIKREVEKYYPICRKYDGELLEKIAAVLNRASMADESRATTSYPESGYGIAYRTEIDELQKAAREAAGIADTENP